MTTDGNPTAHRVLAGVAPPKTLRLAARSTCFWYEALHVARASSSCRYRIGHLVQQMVGASAVVGPRLPADTIAQTRTLSCIRPLVSNDHRRVLASLRLRGVRLVGDYDDLLFAGDVGGLPETVTGSLSERARGARLTAYAAGLDTFDAFTVSTRALARELAALRPKAAVFVVPNGLSEPWVRQGLALYARWQPGDELVVRYFSGSPSHDADFASIAAPLCEFLVAQPAVRVEVIGSIHVDQSRFPPGRVTHLPTLSYDELPRLLASSWVNLAPLVESRFTRCKSAIKFLEAAAFDAPTLAAPCDDVLRHEEQGAPLQVYRSEAEFYQALTALLDPERRIALGRAAGEYVRSHGMADLSLKGWQEAMRCIDPR